MVRMLVADEPLGVTEGGAKEHWDKGGRPAQEKLTGWLKPPIGVTVNTKVALPPAVMVTPEGEAAIEKSGTTRFTSWEIAGENELAKSASPLY